MLVSIDYKMITFCENDDYQVNSNCFHRNNGCELYEKCDDCFRCKNVNLHSAHTTKSVDDVSLLFYRNSKGFVINGHITMFKHGLPEKININKISRIVIDGIEVYKENN